MLTSRREILEDWLQRTLAKTNQLAKAASFHQFCALDNTADHEIIVYRPNEYKISIDSTFKMYEIIKFKALIFNAHGMILTSPRAKCLNLSMSF